MDALQASEVIEATLARAGAPLTDDQALLLVGALAVCIEKVRAAAQPAPAAVPEGCTPADAAMLRRANHAPADEVHLLRTALADLHRQVQEFVATYGEADFYTGPALAVLAKTSPLEYRWPYSSPSANEVIAKLLAAAPAPATGGEP